MADDILTHAENIKDRLLSVLFRCGVDLRRASRSPFGVRWSRDIRFFPSGETLETVLDVGANVGQTALRIRRDFPESRVYSFEPVRSTFQELVRNTTQDARIEPIYRALGASRGTARMKAEHLAGTNTLLATELHSDVSWQDVEVDTVDGFCADRGIRRVNLLKIDTEGYETNVLKGAEGLLVEERIDFILAECDFAPRGGEPHGNFFEIARLISPFGFHVVSFYTGAVDGCGWIWGDVLFGRSSKQESDSASGTPAHVLRERRIVSS